MADLDKAKIEANQEEVDQASEQSQGEKGPLSVRVSQKTFSKANQLSKYIKYSTANGAWGKDEKLIKYNLLVVPTATNYTVLLALGRRRGKGVR